MSGLSRADTAAIDALYELAGPLRLRNCPVTPTPRQEAFLLLKAFEALFGGGAGGGKSIALLAAALQYSDVPGYHALLLRPTLSELGLPGGLIELSHEWLDSSRAEWNSELKQWRFPGPGRSGAGGATLGFGYLEHPNDIGRYAGSNYTFLGIDELSRIDEQLYRRMFRVLRPTASSAGPSAPDGTRLRDVPVRVRATSNPGGPGNSWVKHRFVDPQTRPPGTFFLPSLLADNPHLDEHAYTMTLAHLPPAERERLLHGDWEIPDDGELFQRGWFEIIAPRKVPERARAVRYWDLAATEPSAANNDPDYTVGLRLELDCDSGVFSVTDLVRVRKAPGAVEQVVISTARRDGRETAIVIEEEPGSSGKAVTDRYKSQLLRGYPVHSRRVTGAKTVRAQPVAAAAENGLVKIVRGPHTGDFLDELTSFPHGRHDDCVDALAGAHEYLSRTTSRQGTSSVPRGYLPGVPHTHARWTTVDAADPAAEIAARVGAYVYPARH